MERLGKIVWALETARKAFRAKNFEFDRDPLIEGLEFFVSDLHAANVAAGWWTDKDTGESLKGRRNPYELHALMHSEISEALEADRKNLRDDKLAHRWGVEVELADFLIRQGDWLGSRELEMPFAYAVVVMMENPYDIAATMRKVNTAENLDLIHEEITFSSYLLRRDEDEKALIHQARAFAKTVILADNLHMDLSGAFVEKLAYNKTRADHKLENRRKDGGKAY